MARCMLPVTEMPPRAAFAIFRPRSCAPGATPSNPDTLNRLCPAAMPATWLPCPPLSKNRSSSGAPSAWLKLAACARRRVPADGEGSVAGGRQGGEGDATLTRKVAQLDDLGRPGAGGDQAVHARVYAGVEDRDQDSTPVVGRMLDAELIHARVLERHEPGHERDRGGQGGLPRGHGGGVGRRRRCSGRGGGPLCRDGGGGGASRGAAAGGDQSGQGDAAAIAGHEALGRTKAPRWGPGNSVVASSRKARTSRVSSGGTMASTKPRAPANRASSCRS